MIKKTIAAVIVAASAFTSASGLAQDNSEAENSANKDAFIQLSADAADAMLCQSNKGPLHAEFCAKVSELEASVKAVSAACENGNRPQAEDNCKRLVNYAYYSALDNVYRKHIPDGIKLTIRDIKP